MGPTSPAGVGIDSIATEIVDDGSGNFTTVITIILTDDTKYSFNLPGAAVSSGQEYEAGSSELFAELVKGGATSITLTDDVDITAAAATLEAVDQELTIDLNGNTLTLSTEKQLSVAYGGSVAVKNGTVVGQDLSLGDSTKGGTFVAEGYVSVPGVSVPGENNTYTITEYKDVDRATYPVIAGTGAFKTLSDAVKAFNVAEKAPLANGALVVDLAAGTDYSLEGLSVVRDDVTLKGAGADSTTLTLTAAESGQAGLEVAADGLTVKDTIEGEIQGIFLRAGEANISNSTISTSFEATNEDGHHVQKELGRTFNSYKQMLLRHLLTILQGKQGRIKAVSLYMHDKEFEYVFEFLVDSVFGTEVVRDFYNEYCYEIDGRRIPASKLRPDTIMENPNGCDPHYYVLDAKYYNFGYTKNPRDLPQAAAIAKQIGYNHYLSNSKKKIFYSVFLLPFAKGADDEPIKYVGYAANASSFSLRADKKDKEDEMDKADKKMDKVAVCLVDLKTLVDVYFNVAHKKDGTPIGKTDLRQALIKKISPCF